MERMAKGKRQKSPRSSVLLKACGLKLTASSRNRIRKYFH
jgi:hypothetical protein